MRERVPERHLGELSDHVGDDLQGVAARSTGHAIQDRLEQDKQLQDRQRAQVVVAILKKQNKHRRPPQNIHPKHIFISLLFLLFFISQQ